MVNPLHPEGHHQSGGRGCSSGDDAKSFGTPDKTSPIVATSYRLAEHFHYWTKNVHDQCRDPAGDVRRDLASGWPRPRASSQRRLGRGQSSQRGIDQGQGGRSPNASVPMTWSTARPCDVDRPADPLRLRRPHARSPTRSIHADAASVGDASTNTPEYKAFLVDVEENHPAGFPAGRGLIGEGDDVRHCKPSISAAAQPRPKRAAVRLPASPLPSLSPS